MDAFRIQGGARLSGRIAIDGSKNASLPLMAAALLGDAPVTLRGVPALSDTTNMIRLLAELGARVDRFRGSDAERGVGPGAGADVGQPLDAMVLSNEDVTRTHARYEIVCTMRASICVLGPLLARRGRARVSMPGGCAFGARPVDLHLRGLEALGARIDLEGGDIVATADRLRGTTIFLGGPFGSTVLGTANIMSAATLAEGVTVIESAACEPEIVDLARLLNAMGARITGAGSPRVTIEGVERLGGANHTIIPDRIVAGTYACAAAITRGDVVIDRFPYDSLLAVVDRLQAIGVRIERLDPTQPATSCTVRVCVPDRLAPAIITTQPYPGFPTDLQAQMMALLCLADGNSIITEKIYPERFMHVAELTRMGAQLFRQGPTVVVQGSGRLIGAPVMASDLRASASLVIAGLAAGGETTVSRVYHLDRGYVRMERTLESLGAHIERYAVESTPATETSLAIAMPAGSLSGSAGGSSGEPEPPLIETIRGGELSPERTRVVPYNP